MDSGTLKTSEQWQCFFPSVRVLDPDGWDRRGDYHYSWYVERITREEYENRVIMSTCEIQV